MHIVRLLVAPLVGLSLTTALVGALGPAEKELQAAAVTSFAVADTNPMAADAYVGTVLSPAVSRRPKPQETSRRKVRITVQSAQKWTYLRVGERAKISVTVTPKEIGRPIVLERRDGIRWIALRRTRIKSAATSFSLDTTTVRSAQHRIVVPRHKGRPKATSKRFRVVVSATPTTPTTPPPPAPPMTPAALPMPEPQGNPSQYAFMVTDSVGVPARWNPCVPITWGYNPAGSSASALADVADGINRLAEQTGYTLVFSGETSESALPSVEPDEPRTSPDLLISFGDENTRPDRFTPGSRIAGVGGPSTIYRSNYRGDPQEIVRGDILLRTNGYSASLPGYAIGSRFGRTVIHELGHAVNLGHVQEDVQVMYPTGSAWSTTDHRGYNLGDRAGLKTLGTQAGCFTRPQR